jgi:hypothetical protein
MDKRESRPRELTDEEIKAVAGGNSVGPQAHAYGQDPLLPAKLSNTGNGPKSPNAHP